MSRSRVLRTLILLAGPDEQSIYLLKEYNRRWFLSGYCASARRIHTFLLDRIRAVHAAPAQRFPDTPEFNPATWYEHIVDVSGPTKANPSTS